MKLSKNKIPRVFATRNQSCKKNKNKKYRHHFSCKKRRGYDIKNKSMKRRRRRHKSIGGAPGKASKAPKLQGLLKRGLKKSGFQARHLTSEDKTAIEANKQARKSAMDRIAGKQAALRKKKAKDPLTADELLEKTNLQKETKWA